MGTRGEYLGFWWETLPAIHNMATARRSGPRSLSGSTATGSGRSHGIEPIGSASAPATRSTAKAKEWGLSHGRRRILRGARLTPPSINKGGRIASCHYRLAPRWKSGAPPDHWLHADC